jgi:CheY-like chemotaxis protein
MSVCSAKGGAVHLQAKRRYWTFVVDDNRDAAHSFALVLRTLGCEASFTSDPRNALTGIARLKPQIVFLDIEMPHLNGYQLAQLLRAEYQEGLKLVAVTGYGEERDRAACRKAGFDAHVLKPVDPALVLSILETVLPES